MVKLNVYLITRADGWGYEAYDSAVVIAKDEIEARSIHPSGCVRYIEGQWAESDGYVLGFHGWCHHNAVRVKLITAYAGTEFKAGDVICASYNAGEPHFNISTDEEM